MVQTCEKSASIDGMSLCPVVCPDTTTANTDASRGFCAVKAEYCRTAPIRVGLDIEGRIHGMNKGCERLKSCVVEGTQRPEFTGEVNFFYGETLKRIKAVVRQCDIGKKRGRDAETGQIDKEGAGLSNDFENLGEKSVVMGENEHDTSKNFTKNDNFNAVSMSDGARNCDSLRVSFSEEHARENAARRLALFANKLVLAPLTTVGNLPFRRVCKEYGADVTVSEMAFVTSLKRLQKSEWSLLRRHESEDIFGLQIAVSRPQEAVFWAQTIEASGYSYDFVDINCGCPLDKVVRSGCGCGLWERKGNKLRDVVHSLVHYQSKPVSIKCRIGPDEAAPLLHKQIKEYESWGVSAVSIHGRSRKQRYTKLANWAYINECAALTSLPVIGNGDIFSYNDISDHRESFSHIDSYMIGRGALIKPWIFEEIKTGQLRDISSHERFEIIRRFCNYGLSHWGSDERGVLTTRRFLCEWLSFLCRYVPLGLLERPPQRMNERPPYYEGRDELETLMASDNVVDWIRISEMLLGPAGDKFKFTPKHRARCYATVGSTNEGDMEVEG